MSIYHQTHNEISLLLKSLIMEPYIAQEDVEKNPEKCLSGFQHYLRHSDRHQL